MELLLLFDGKPAKNSIYIRTDSIQNKWWIYRSVCLTAAGPARWLNYFLILIKILSDGFTHVRIYFVLVYPSKRHQSGRYVRVICLLLLNILFFCVARSDTAWRHSESASTWACWARSPLFVAAGDHRRQCYPSCCYAAPCPVWSYLKSLQCSKASCWWLCRLQSCSISSHPCLSQISLDGGSPALRRHLLLPGWLQPSDYSTAVPAPQYSSATTIVFCSWRGPSLAFGRFHAVCPAFSHWDRDASFQACFRWVDCCAIGPCRMSRETDHWCCVHSVWLCPMHWDWQVFFMQFQASSRCYYCCFSLGQDFPGLFCSPLILLGFVHRPLLFDCPWHCFRTGWHGIAPSCSQMLWLWLGHWTWRCLVAADWVFVSWQSLGLHLFVRDAKIPSLAETSSDYLSVVY